MGKKVGYAVARILLERVVAESKESIDGTRFSDQNSLIHSTRCSVLLILFLLRALGI